ncbi:MAG TPA: hypothetical protein DEA55_05865 [Rhodospirillaceae bacterium]|nr:hypothetical protein [Rhodospirillaceae bacterium]
MIKKEELQQQKLHGDCVKGTDKKFKNNTNLLRLAAIAVSLLFIPAFVYGIVSLWSVVYAVVVALFFRSQLNDLIIECNKIQQPELEYWYLRPRVLILVLEVTVVTLLPQLWILLFGWDNLQINSDYLGFMSQVNTQVNLYLAQFLFGLQFSGFLNIAQMFVVNIIFSSLSICVALFLISPIQMYRVMRKYYYKQAPEMERDSEYLYSKYHALGRWLPFLAVAFPLLSFSYIVIELEKGNVDILELGIFCSAFYFFSFLVFAFFSAAYAAITRKFSKT